MIGEPRVPLFDAVSPELLLLARLVWHPEDVPAAASLVDESKLPLLARPLFELLTAENREPDVVALRKRVEAEHPELALVLEHACCVPFALYELVSVEELALEISAPRPRRVEEPRELGQRFPALARWRDQVLAKPGRRRPLEVAAAWEFTAIECGAAGRTREAARARRFAKGAVLKKVG